jgi:ABC-type dipeptide/oligopeptide/nickel transport system permease component
MARYVAARLAAAIPTLILITIAAFLLSVAAKGDPALLALKAGGQEPTAEAVAAYRVKLGLDDPLPVRYVRWLGNVAQGDFGRSTLDGRKVTAVIGERIVPTLRLGVSAFAVAATFGVGLGVVFGLRANSALDVGGRFVSLLLAAIPSFWLALILIVVVGERWKLLPVAGYGGVDYLVLPVIALAAGPAASLMRYTRSATIEVWRQDYVRTARAKGLSDRTNALRHALPNAMLPILTILGLRFGQILAGAIVIEVIFSWPGMGTAVLNAISARDLPIISAYVLMAGVLFILINLITDIGYVLLDPRIRLGAGGRR